jgi:hypothetical protein
MTGILFGRCHREPARRGSRFPRLSTDEHVHDFADERKLDHARSRNKALTVVEDVGADISLVVCSPGVTATTVAGGSRPRRCREGRLRAAPA